MDCYRLPEAVLRVLGIGLDSFLLFFECSGVGNLSFSEMERNSAVVCVQDGKRREPGEISRLLSQFRFSKLVNNPGVSISLGGVCGSQQQGFELLDRPERRLDPRCYASLWGVLDFRENVWGFVQLAEICLGDGIFRVRL
ncbi:hypothetical protein OGAPHI_001573 [Ogataea philodendri]|uniref:Uncharacterized protein n=1 Tax=Ogataea philodendri TaxID=1378263 RepID=A0A9P8PCH1_9ASCO|nr:uncharacterized protein OGAPHI_001573 [Ogataea philodendri]KAH3669452.1 hypothetical protein OGAPHI_001573 [Ogataea philodendri]